MTGRDTIAVKAIILDIDGTLIESMAVDTELYFASIAEVLGPVRTRDKLSDYDHVTDSGILAQLLDDNGYVHDGEVDSVRYFGDAVWDERACRRLDWNFVAVGPGLGGIESYKEVEL